MNCFEEEVDSKEDSEGDWEYNCDRLDVNKIGPSQAPTIVKITLTSDTKYRTKVPG